MKALDALIACAGSWRGTNTLHEPNTNKPEDSPTTATVTPVLGGRFVRLDYTWSYQGKPQEGSLLFGFDAQADTVTAHWIDSWHMGDKVMACVDPRPGNPIISVRGSYSDPGGSEWGWRIEITPEEGRSLRLVMFNLWPDGQREDLAVEASFDQKDDLRSSHFVIY